MGDLKYFHHIGMDEIRVFLFLFREVKVGVPRGNGINELVRFGAGGVSTDDAPFRNGNGEVTGNEGVDMTASQVYLYTPPVQPRIVLCRAVWHTESV